MKTKLLQFRAFLWKLLTEVPGWPDAPRAVRVRRILPVVLPVVGLLVLAAWNIFIFKPQIAAGRSSYQPLQALQDEIDGLRMNSSDQQAAEIAARTKTVASLALPNPAALPAVLAALKKDAADRGWAASFHPGDATDDNRPADAQIFYLPVRAKLTPFPGDPDAFKSLLALLERFSVLDKRIDLTRLAIRADEQGRYAVELNLRLASLTAP